MLDTYFVRFYKFDKNDSYYRVMSSNESLYTYSMHEKTEKTILLTAKLIDLFNAIKYYSTLVSC